MIKESSPEVVGSKSSFPFLSSSPRKLPPFHSLDRSVNEIISLRQVVGRVLIFSTGGYISYNFSFLVPKYLAPWTHLLPIIMFDVVFFSFFLFCFVIVCFPFC